MVLLRIMKRSLFIIPLLVLLAGCGSGGGGGTTTAATGGGSGGTGTLLTWTRPTTRLDGTALPEAEIAGYKIYFGTSSGAYAAFITVTGATQYEIVTIPPTLSSGTYYFVVAAYDTAGVESAYSTQTPVVIP